jgi:hypothetical protein
VSRWRLLAVGAHLALSLPDTMKRMNLTPPVPPSGSYDDPDAGWSEYQEAFEEYGTLSFASASWRPPCNWRFGKISQTSP